MYAGAAGGLQQAPGKFELLHRLAAGNGHASAGNAVKQFILQDFGKHFGHSHCPSDRLNGPGVASLGASAAAQTVLPVKNVPAVFHPVAMPGTNFETPAAAYAFAALKKYFRFLPQ